MDKVFLYCIELRAQTSSFIMFQLRMSLVDETLNFPVYCTQKKTASFCQINAVQKLSLIISTFDLYVLDERLSGSLTMTSFS